MSLLALLWATGARADLLPADEMPIPRLVQLRGVERLSGVVVIQNCYPRRSVEDATVLPYCVIRDDRPFVAGGKLYLAPKDLLQLRNRTAAVDDGGAVARLRAAPVLIESPPVNVVDPDAFFKDPRLGKTDIDFGIRDHIAVKQATRLARVTEIYDVEARDGGLALRPAKVEWTCASGKQIQGPAPRGPNQLPPAPSCEAGSAPAPSATASGSPARAPSPASEPESRLQLWTLALLAAVVAAIAFVVIKKR